MEPSFDLVVIGTGAAGATAAYRCREAGWKVAIVDSRPFGGTCALRGCDPKKVLVGAAEAIDQVRRLEGKGIAARDAAIDWPALIKFKRTFTDPVPEVRERGYVDAGIAAFHSCARFTGPAAINVGTETLTSRHFLIASGARPGSLGIPGEEHLTDSTHFMEMETLPNRIAFIGGGYISFEFAHVARRAGAHVTILHNSPRPLAGFDPDLVDQLVQTSQEIGIEIKLNAPVSSIEKSGSGLIVRTSGAGGGQSCEADVVVHGAGRIPEIDDLDLDIGGIRFGKAGVAVNEFLQSDSNPAVYAAGDCAAAPIPRLTPVASMEGEVAAANLLRGNHRRVDFTEVPSVVYTVPPLATVGLHEQAAKEQGLKFRVNRQDTTGWYSSRRIGVRYSGTKVLVEEGSDRILGAHLFGPHADEVINLFALAIRFRLTATDLNEMIFAYPTGASDIGSMV